MYNLHSALSITVSANVTPILSNQSPPFTMIHSITWFYAQIIHILDHNLLPCFPGPASFSGSPNLQSSTFFSPNHHHLYYRNLLLHTTFIMSSIPNHCLNSILQNSLSLNFKQWGSVPAVPRASPKPG